MSPFPPVLFPVINTSWSCFTNNIDHISVYPREKHVCLQPENVFFSEYLLHVLQSIYSEPSLCTEIALLCRVCFHCIPLMTFPLRFRLSLAVPNISCGDLAQGNVKELLFIDPHSCFWLFLQIISSAPYVIFQNYLWKEENFLENLHVSRSRGSYKAGPYKVNRETGR